MKVILEFTAEDFKENLGKTLEELFVGEEKKPVKKTAKKKPEPEEDEEEIDEEETDEEEESDEDAEVDVDMIREGISKAVASGNKAKVAALFATFKAKGISSLKESQFTKFYEKLKPLTKKK